MVDPLSDPRIAFLQQALDGLSLRQQAIAGNIANVDTPGYQRQDVPFEASLRASLNSSAGMQLMTQTGQPALSGASSSLLSMAAGMPSGRTSTTRNDGNNVDIDYEMTQMADTALRYELLTQAASSRFSVLSNIVGHT